MHHLEDKLARLRWILQIHRQPVKERIFSRVLRSLVTSTVDFQLLSFLLASVWQPSSSNTQNSSLLNEWLLLRKKQVAGKMLFLFFAFTHLTQADTRLMNFATTSPSPWFWWRPQLILFFFVTRCSWLYLWKFLLPSTSSLERGVFYFFFLTTKIPYVVHEWTTVIVIPLHAVSYTWFCCCLCECVYVVMNGKSKTLSFTQIVRRKICTTQIPCSCGLLIRQSNKSSSRQLKLKCTQ